MPERGETKWCSGRRGQACALTDNGSTLCVLGGFDRHDTKIPLVDHQSFIGQGLCLQIRLTPAVSLITAKSFQGRLCISISCA